METDTRRMRGLKPFIFANMQTGQGVDAVIDFITRQGMLTEQ